MELGLKPSEHKGNISPFGSCLTECGICGPLCNSSGRELKRKRKRKDCKSSHREVTCLSASQFRRPGHALMLAFRGQPSLIELLSRKYGLIKKMFQWPITSEMFALLIMAGSVSLCMNNHTNLSGNQRPHLQSGIQGPGDILLEVCLDRTRQFLIINAADRAAVHLRVMTPRLKAAPSSPPAQDCVDQTCFFDLQPGSLLTSRSYLLYMCRRV